MRAIAYILAAGGALLGAPFLGACQRAPEPPPSARVPKTLEAPSVRVQAATATLGRVSGTRLASGTVAPWQATRIVPQTGGTVVRRTVDNGQTVAAGALLFALDSSRQRLAVEQAETALEGARNDLAWLEKDLARKQQLLAGKAIRPLEVDAVEHQTRRARTGVKQAELAVKNAKRALADTVLRAPHPGVVNGRQVDVGDTVGPGVPLLELVDLSRIRVKVGLKGRDVARLETGATAEVSFGALGGRPRPATVAAVAPRADPRTGLFEVELHAENADRRVRAGMVATCLIHAPTAGDDQVLVPRAALFRRRGLQHVFVVDDGIARLRAVETGDGDGTHMEIQSGVDAGAVVVTSGVHALEDGTRLVVEVQPDEAVDTPAAPSAAVDDGGAPKG